MLDTESRRYKWRMIALCLFVLILMLAFFYDLYRSTGKSGEAISQNATWPLQKVRCTSGQLP
jgi:hypothetical protein